jgi:hypothetical protein
LLLFFDEFLLFGCWSHCLGSTGDEIFIGVFSLALFLKLKDSRESRESGRFFNNIYERLFRDGPDRLMTYRLEESHPSR